MARFYKNITIVMLSALLNFITINPMGYAALDRPEIINAEKITNREILFAQIWNYEQPSHTYSRSLGIHHKHNKKRKIDLANLEPPRQKQTNVLQLKQLPSMDDTKVYSKDFNNKLLSQYKTVVVPYENKVVSPYNFATTQERDQYQKSRHDLAKWTTQEVLDQNFRDVLKGADHDSAPLRMMQSVHGVLGSNALDDVFTKQQNNTGATRTPSANATNSAISSNQNIAASGITPEQETKLNAKLKLLRGQGQVQLANPVVETALSVDALADEKVNVNLKKELQTLDLNSTVNYGLVQKTLNVAVNKKLTDQLTLQLLSQRYTYVRSDGNRGQETLGFLYALHF